MKVRFLPLILFFCTWAFPFQEVKAANPVTPAEEMDQETKTQIFEEFARARKEALEAEQQKRSFLGELYEVKKKIKKVDDEKESLERSILKVKRNARKQAGTIVMLERQIKSQKEALQKQLRTMYKYEDYSTLKMIFSSQNPAELDRNLKFVKIVADRNYTHLKQYRQDREKILLNRKELSGKIQQLAELERKYLSEKKRLLGEQSKKSEKIISAEDVKNQKLAQIDKIRSSSSKLQNMIGKDFYDMKNQLTRPVAGKLVQNYGEYADPDFNYRVYNKGWYLEAPQGSPVKTVFHGKVAFSSWLNGYGNTVIVDHGANYYTVYANLTDLKVKTGEEVTDQFVIGAVANDRYKMNSGLYFEVRHFSESMDPKDWIATNK